MKNQKNLVCIFIGLVVVLGVVVYVDFWKNNGMGYGAKTENTLSTTTDSNQTTSAETAKKASNSYLAQDGVYVIKYTNAGFVPKDIQIPKGKSVRFINMSDQGMRIVTDNTDPKFVGLNEAKTVGKGSTYTFTFSEVGLWVYHNQSTPTMKATILINQF